MAGDLVAISPSSSYHRQSGENGGCLTSYHRSPPIVPDTKKKLKAVAKTAEKKLVKKEHKLVKKLEKEALKTPSPAFVRLGKYRPPVIKDSTSHNVQIREAVRQHYFPELVGPIRQENMYGAFTGTMQDRTVIPFVCQNISTPTNISSYMFIPTTNPSIACWSSNTTADQSGQPRWGNTATFPQDNLVSQINTITSAGVSVGGANNFVQVDTQAPDRVLFSKVRMHTCTISITCTGNSMATNGFILVGHMPNPELNSLDPITAEYSYTQIQFNAGKLAGLQGVVTIPFSQLVQTGGARVVMHKMSPLADEYVAVVDFLKNPGAMRPSGTPITKGTRCFDKKLNKMVGNPPVSDSVLLQGLDFFVPFIVVCNTDGGAQPSFEVIISRSFEGAQVYETLLSGGLSLPAAGSGAPTRDAQVTRKLNEIARHTPVVPNPSMKLDVESIVDGILHVGRKAGEFAMSPAGQAAMMTFAEIAGGLILA